MVLISIAATLIFVFMYISTCFQSYLEFHFMSLLSPFIKSLTSAVDEVSLKEREDRTCC